MLDNHFTFHVPVDIVKGADGAETEMKLAGIASTSDKDRDGETLIPEGFDYSYLAKSGYINWHHQTSKDPTAIIGEPEEVKIVPQGLYILGRLYPSSDMARKAYEQTKIIGKDSTTRKMGWSIEGRVLERDPKNPAKVLKAAITGVALTPMPINPKTFVSIIKGMDAHDTSMAESYQPQAPQAAPLPTTTTPGNGGKQYLLESNFSGGKIKIDTSGSAITIELDESTRKAMTTANAAAVMPASVEGTPKTMISGENQKPTMETKVLMKSEFMELAKQAYPNLSEATLETIWAKAMETASKK